MPPLSRERRTWCRHECLLFGPVVVEHPAWVNIHRPAIEHVPSVEDVRGWDALIGDSAAAFVLVSVEFFEPVRVECGVAGRDSGGVG